MSSQSGFFFTSLLFSVCTGDSSEKSKYDEVSGEVVIEARWFPLYDSRECLSGDVSALGPSGMIALVSVFVYSCNNLMDPSLGGDQALPTLW